MLSGSKNISEVDSKNKFLKMCRPLLASKIKVSWFTKASHVCFAQSEGTWLLELKQVQIQKIE